MMTRPPPGRSTAPPCRRCWTTRRPPTGSWPIRTSAPCPWTARSTSSTPQTCSCTPGTWPGPLARTTGWTPASAPNCWPGWGRWKRPCGPPAITGRESRCPMMPTRRPGCWASSAGTPPGHLCERHGRERADIRRPGARPGGVLRECLPLSKRPVHDVEANVSVYRVAKRLRHRGEDLKAERAPQPDRRCIGFDDRIELHRPVAVRACLFKDAAAQSPACALAAPRRIDDKTGIGHVCPRARMNGMSVRAPDYAAVIVHGDDGAPGQLPHPPRAGPGLGSGGIPRQGLASGTDLCQDQPDGGPVLGLRLTYHHVASMEQPALS